MPEKMLQVPIRTDILDNIEKYIERFNESDKVLYKLKKPQLISEAIMEYMVNHPAVSKEGS